MDTSVNPSDNIAVLASAEIFRSETARGFPEHVPSDDETPRTITRSSAELLATVGSTDLPLCTDEHHIDETETPNYELRSGKSQSRTPQRWPSRKTTPGSNSNTDQVSLSTTIPFKLQVPSADLESRNRSIGGPHFSVEVSVDEKVPDSAAAATSTISGHDAEPSCGQVRFERIQMSRDNERETCFDVHSDQYSMVSVLSRHAMCGSSPSTSSADFATFSDSSSGMSSSTEETDSFISPDDQIIDRLMDRLVSLWIEQQVPISVAASPLHQYSPVKGTGQTTSTRRTRDRPLKTKSSGLGVSSQGQQEGDENDSNGGDDDDQDRRPPRRLNTKSNPEPSGDNYYLRCPFSAFDPFRYSDRNLDPTEVNYKRCSACALRDIATLKQHVKRIHKVPDHYCARCFTIFASRELLDQHSRQIIWCPTKICPFPERMSELQSETLKRRILGKSTEQKWYSIYRMLFPGADEPPSPYIEKDLEVGAQDFIDFFQSQGPRIIATYLSEGGFTDPMIQWLTQNLVLERSIKEITRRYHIKRRTGDAPTPQIRQPLVDPGEDAEHCGSIQDVRKYSTKCETPRKTGTCNRQHSPFQGEPDPLNASFHQSGFHQMLSDGDRNSNERDFMPEQMVVHFPVDGKPAAPIITSNYPAIHAQNPSKTRMIPQVDPLIRTNDLLQPLDPSEHALGYF